MASLCQDSSRVARIRESVKKLSSVMASWSEEKTRKARCRKRPSGVARKLPSGRAAAARGAGRAGAVAMPVTAGWATTAVLLCGAGEERAGRDFFLAMRALGWVRTVPNLAPRVLAEMILRSSFHGPTGASRSHPGGGERRLSRG